MNNVVSCVFLFLAGLVTGIFMGLVLVESKITKIKSEAIDHGYAKYEVSNKGNIAFVWTKQ